MVILSKNARTMRQQYDKMKQSILKTSVFSCFALPHKRRRDMVKSISIDRTSAIKGKFVRSADADVIVLCHNRHHISIGKPS